MRTHTRTPQGFSSLRVGTFIAVALAVGLGGLSCRGPGLAKQAEPQWRLAAAPLPTPVKAIWVARFHYRYADDIRTIMANCAAEGCNTVLWQVRGEGTVSYPSKIEPWAREYDFKDPGFDPLAVAVEAAHQHGLRIEAYVNVMPGWKGKEPPPADLRPKQLYHAHPDWFLHDAAGNQQPLGEFYVVVNPCWPEVRKHIVSVVDEIVSKYDVDGVHLDYVRYAWDGVPKAKDKYPRDAKTLGLYRRETGHAPDDDVKAWDHWRANQITRLVADIRATVEKRRPGLPLTAAVWRSPQRGYNEFLQNSVAWLRSGLVDAVMPMAYSAQLEPFADDVAKFRQLASGRRVVPGIGLYLQDTEEQARQQVQRCEGWGGDFALFSYESLYPTAGDRKLSAKAREDSQRLRHVRRTAIQSAINAR